MKPWGQTTAVHVAGLDLTKARHIGTGKTVGLLTTNPPTRHSITLTAVSLRELAEHMLALAEHIEGGAA